MAKHTLKVLWCEGRKIFKISLTIFHYYILKGQAVAQLSANQRFSGKYDYDNWNLYENICYGASW